MLYRIGEVAEIFNVTIQTVRNWDKQGKISSIRTSGNQRRYKESEISRLKGAEITDDRKTLVYARVSTASRKNDLERQKQVLELFCAAKGWSFITLSDIGSGLNYNKKGLLKLIELIETNQIERLVLNYKDRLLRFGNEIIFEMCKYHDVEIVVITDNEDKIYEQELTEDVLSIITVFSAKLHGGRSHKNKQVVEQAKELFDESTQSS
jgi:excisionase family DNA binding protein